MLIDYNQVWDITQSSLECNAIKRDARYLKVSLPLFSFSFPVYQNVSYKKISKLHAMSFFVIKYFIRTY